MDRDGRALALHPESRGPDQRALTGAVGASDLGAGMNPAVETVIIVDDDTAVLDVAAKVLERGGYTVLTASSGLAALEAAASYGAQVSLLLTDVVMPGMGGRELSDRFAERYPDVPVVFMSAYTEDEVIIQGVRLDEVNFIGKPFTVEGLRAKVRAVIDASRK